MRQPKPATSGRLIREMQTGDKLFLVLDGRELGRISIQDPQGAKVRLCLEIDREIRIERREEER